MKRYGLYILVVSNFVAADCIAKCSNYPWKSHVESDVEVWSCVAITLGPTLLPGDLRGQRIYIQHHSNGHGVASLGGTVFGARVQVLCDWRSVGRHTHCGVLHGQQRIHDGTQVVTGDSRPLLAGRRVELPALKLTMTDNAEDVWGSQSRP